MFLNWMFLVIGMALLVGGAEALVRGAGGLALLAKMTPAVIALTVVSAGTSMPELVVSARAALAGNPGLSLGNAVGSNFLNIGLVLGLTALIMPLNITGNTMKFEWPTMMMATLIFFFLSRDGNLDRLEGLFMTLALIAFMAYAVFLDKHGVVSASPGEPLQTASFGCSGPAAVLLNGSAVILGIAMLAIGANFLVKGAVAAAAGLGVSETVIGLTIVAVGTSAPELVTSIVAALRGRTEMAVGNVVGSCIFNLLGILGISALITPLKVPSEISARDVIWLLGITAVLFPMMGSAKKLNRYEGVILMGGFFTYTAILIVGA